MCPHCGEDHDGLFDKAMVVDFFGARYGWFPEDWEAKLPPKMPAALLTLAGIRTELEEEKARRNAAD